MKKNAGDLKMSVKQARKLCVLERLCEGRMSNREAASNLNLSVRQTQRVKSRFSKLGPESLVHGNTGGKPSNYVAEHIRDFVAQQAMTRWEGASSHHMSELLLAEKGLHLSAKTMTRILKERGIKNPFTHKGPKKHRRRERKKRLGEMVQVDASPFDWLCNGSMLVLHGAIDDATGKILALWLEPTECLFGYFHVLDRMIRTFGVPGIIYSDAHTIFFSPKSGKLSVEEELKGCTVALTQFGKALDILNTKPLKASSAQAKGRVERLWGTLQHRLVVDMRLAGISTIEEANAFLATYPDKHNERFAVEPEREESAFLPAPSPDDLPYILCKRAFRKASGDSTISWKGRKLLLLDEKHQQKLLRRGAAIEVLTLLDGSDVALHDGVIHHLDVPKDADDRKASLKDTAKKTEKDAKEKTPVKPAPDHPWRRWYGNKTNPRELIHSATSAAKEG
jgi:transposase